MQHGGGRTVVRGPSCKRHSFRTGILTTDPDPPPLVSTTASLASLGPLPWDAGGQPGIHPPISHPDFPLGNLPLCSLPQGPWGKVLNGLLACLSLTTVGSNERI